MTDDQKRLEELLDKYTRNAVNQQEFNELCSMIKASGNDAALKSILEVGLNDAPFKAMDKVQMDSMLRKISLILNPSPKEKDFERAPVRRMFLWRRVAVAASIILAVGVGSYFLFFNNSRKKNDFVKTTDTLPHDVPAPNVARATLKLDDGRIVYLDSAKNGSLAMQGNINVVKLADGQIVYQGNETGEVKYNTITNQRGSKVQALTLSDGTKVWLNAESSITYPTAFAGNERKVSIAGEADFIVTHNEKMPFKVIANGTEIRDVGTEFNINAYNDEPNIKVTLLEGSVKVIKGNSEQTLSPGQQAQVSDRISVVSNVNTDAVMAWKNGQFILKGTDVATLMRQVARWYDVDVVFNSKIPEKKFGGSVSRDVNLSTVLQALKEYGVVCRLDGKKVIVD